jgi:hypothetical protein
MGDRVMTYGDWYYKAPGWLLFVDSLPTTHRIMINGWSGGGAGGPVIR